MPVNPSRVITSEEAHECAAWIPPSVEGFGAGGHLPTARQLEQVHQDAHRDGFETGRAEGRERGYEDGRAAARQELSEQLASLQGILRCLARPLDQLDEEVEHALVDLSIRIARHIVRRELKSNPGEIVAVVREALGQLPIAARAPRVHLNPDDIDMVRQALALDQVEEGIRVDPDPLVSRGGCLVETETSYVDATVEARLAAIISRMLGGERESDRDA